VTVTDAAAWLDTAVATAIPAAANVTTPTATAVRVCARRGRFPPALSRLDTRCFLTKPPN
jgi:hypothetical protein